MSIVRKLRESWAEPVARHGLIGFIGSLILALGALGVGYLPPRSRLGGVGLTDFLRTTSAGRAVCEVLVAVGVIVLLRAWFLVGRDVRAGLITSTRHMTHTFWVWAVPLALAPPLFSQDVYSYTAQGNLLNVGYDPYQFGPSAVPGAGLESVSSVWLDTPAPYGPSFLYIGKLTAEVFGTHVYISALVMRLLALFGVYLIARYLPRLARACGVEPSLAVWAGLLNPLVLMHFVSGAHNDALMLGLVIAGLTFAMEGRPIVGAVAVALGGTVKAPALLVLGFVGLAWAMQREGTPFPRRRKRIVPWVLVSLVTVATFLVMNVLTGLDFGWVSALGTPGKIHTWMSPATTFALTAGHVGTLVGLDDYTDALLKYSRVACQLAVLALVAWWLLRKRAIAPGLGAALTLLLIAVFGPVIQPWYMLWGIVAIAGAGLTRRGVPYLSALTTMLVTYCLIQPSATMRPFLRLPDWVCSAITLGVGAAMLMQNPATRADIVAFPSRLLHRRRPAPEAEPELSDLRT